MKQIRSSLALLLVVATASPAAFAEPPPRAAGAPVAASPAVRVDPALLKVEAPLSREEQRRLAALTPSDRAKIVSAAAAMRGRLAKPPAANEKPKAVDERARDAAVQLGAIGAADIEAIAYLLLMEAAKAEREDLKTIMAGVRAINEAKACGRRAACLNGLKAPDDVDRAAFDAKVRDLKNKLDSLSEMGEMESLRLQMAMDRMSKMMTALSNMLKKLSDTSAGITSNLK